MNLHEEIATKAYEIYEKSGCIGGRDCQNWLEAERIVLASHASQDIEEPDEVTDSEGIAEGISFAAEKKMPITDNNMPAAVAGVGSEEFTNTTGIDEAESILPSLSAKKKTIRSGVKVRSEKIAGFAKTAAAKK